MSSTATVQKDVAQGSKVVRARSTAPARYFFIVAAITMLTVMVAGFHPYYLRGEGMAGRTISPQLATLVFVHGAAMTVWLMVFLVQSLLVPARKLRIHMKLGWGGVVVALVAAGSGFMLAVESVRPLPAIPFWGMAYRQFMFVMLIEMTLFTLFVLAGMLFRKRPKIHKAAMLLASLSILAGATVRMPILVPVFGDGGWTGIFGPVFALGAVLVLMRSFSGKTTDRWLVAGYAIMVAVYIGASSSPSVTPGPSWLEPYSMSERRSRSSGLTSALTPRTNRDVLLRPAR